jgi:hypothetical protein
MIIVDWFKNLFRPAPVATPRLVSARTTDAASRTLLLRHEGSMVHGRFFTRDAAPRTRDAILNAEAIKNYAVELGLVWTGDLRPIGDAIVAVALAVQSAPAKDRAAIIKRITKDLASYGNALGSSEGHIDGNGALVYPADRPEKEFKTMRPMVLGTEQEYGSEAEQLDDINQANEQFWTQTADAAPRFNPTLGNSGTAATMAANMRKHWASANGEPVTMTTDAPAHARAANKATSMPSQVDAINAANRALWGSAA